MATAGVVAGALRETALGERRVAVVPDSVRQLRSLGTELSVEAGCGTAAYFPDEQYTAAGAAVCAAPDVVERADALFCVGPPADQVVATLRTGQLLIGLLGGRENQPLLKRLAAAGVTALSMELLPRTISRAQGMDALTSQANVAGYKAAIVAADVFGGFFPMLVTAAGTMRPATVLVLGAGVAGLQAIGTARRLGAVVTGFDVRPAAREDIRSVGGRCLELPGAPTGSGSDGYARQLTAAELRAQQDALNERIPTFDVVITTAQVPGRKPPVLVTADALARMRPGAVVVDMAAGPAGGNVEGSAPGETVPLESGVTVIGGDDLASRTATAASSAYARNLTTLFASLIHEGQLAPDLKDEIIGPLVVAHDGEVINPEGTRPGPEAFTGEGGGT